jgi:hypothetical protein
LKNAWQKFKLRKRLKKRPQKNVPPNKKPPVKKAKLLKKNVPKMPPLLLKRIAIHVITSLLKSA